MARVCMIVFNEYAVDARVRREAESLVERGDSVDCVCLSRERLTHLCGVRLFSPSGSKYHGANPVRFLLAYAQFFLYAFFTVTVEHFRKPYDIVQAHTMPDF